MTTCGSEEDIRQALSAGAKRYLVKEASRQQAKAFALLREEHHGVSNGPTPALIPSNFKPNPARTGVNACWI
jgi:hypothetical protein